MEITREDQLFQQVVTEAWENETFKNDLIANPVATIEELIGEKLNIPEGKTLVVRDQTDESTVYINIPAEPNTADVELNEEQLEMVSGGVWPGMGIIDPRTIFFPRPYPVIDEKAPDGPPPSNF